MSIHLNPCPKCNNKKIGINSNFSNGEVNFLCHSCGFTTTYNHNYRIDEPIANSAKDYWDNLSCNN